MTPSLILASGSPQRRAILEQLGVEFTVVVPEVEELGAGEPRALVRENALRKARGVAASRGGPPAPDAESATVLGADTAVVLDGHAYGKPRDEGEARTVLERLSGREHEVLGAIALLGVAGERTAVAATRVRFRPLSASDLHWYLNCGEWRGRAGGYAIQGRGAALVERVEGDFWNVVGLPVVELLQMVPELLTSAPSPGD